jgi:hypothetical protein
MVDTEKLQEKLGEVLGLEMAAQKAVEELGSKGLLDENGMLSKLEKMQSQAGNHQSKLEEIVHNLANESGGFELVAADSCTKFIINKVFRNLPSKHRSVLTNNF